MAEEPLNVENHVKVLVESLRLPLRQVVSCAAVTFCVLSPLFPPPATMMEEEGGRYRA